MGTHKVRTTPYAPTDNGVCERGNKVIGASLRALLLEYDNEQWDRLLGQILGTVRSSPHETTGERATYMMLGREDAFHLEFIQADDMDARHMQENCNTGFTLLPVTCERCRGRLRMKPVRSLMSTQFKMRSG